MSYQRVSHCEWCGTPLGFTEKRYDSDPMITCGARECEREANYDMQGRDADARARAEEDDYERYR